MKDFKIVRNLFDIKNYSIDLFQYTKDIKIYGNLNDIQSPGAPSFYKAKEITKVHYKLLPIIEKETELKLYPTYNYFRIYNENSILKPHVDRPACEISCTMNIGYDGNYNWPIWMKDIDGKDHEVILEVGDGLIYFGCSQIHWREDSNCKVKQQSQVFFHFVNQDGPFQDYLLDGGWQF